jgi:CCR4-NOT transcriptional complex subunit CAF120
LSISTAGKNRYLLHFNSLHSLTQWTAGIRLAMFELASLQELYTGSLIAGKGKYLNNIRFIMEKSKFKTEDWARVRFGAGTPWRRCWCVIEPPDEKEWQRANKSLKKKSAYDRPSLPKGVIKFFDTKKTKKAVPIATITDAYSAYAVYPQSKALIDQSTLVKLEGRITIHSKPESKTEGFVFVMPELHAAVTGFEMLLRWLFPVYDSFHLYGRPQRLIADTWDTRGLMFAMPRERRYGYLDIIDVASLIHTQGSDKWSEREWRKQLKDATSKRMAMTSQTRSVSNMDNRRPNRAVSEMRPGVHYDDVASVRSSSSSRHHHNQSTDAMFASPPRTVTAPANGAHLTPGKNHHSRSVSESVAYMSPGKNQRQRDSYNPSRLSAEYTQEPQPIAAAPAPPPHRNPFKDGVMASETETSDSRYSSDSDGQIPRTYPEDVRADIRDSMPPAPVMAPPSMQHQAGDVPQRRPDARSDLRREKSRMSNGTLSQIVDVNRLGGSGATAGHAALVAWNQGRDPSQGYGLSQGENQGGPRGVNETETPHTKEMSANQLVSEEVVADRVLVQSPTDVGVDTGLGRSLSEPLMPARMIARKPVGTTSSVSSPPDHSSTDMAQYFGSTLEVQRESSPDYDSPSEDVSSPMPMRRTRTGVLKTVGDPSISRSHSANQLSDDTDIIAVDFGTTITPALTPGHSRPATATGMLDSPSNRPLTAPATPLTRSPQDERQLAGRLSGSDDRGSPHQRPISRPQHSRSSSYAWRPGSSLSRHDSSGGLTAEEFVQRRASAARMPSGYVPHRSVSFSKLEQSPEATAKKRQSLMGRSSSRNSVLVDYTPHLTAREQEHIARMTGGPLLQLNERSRTPDPTVGLIGAIEAREQEKRNIKEGVAGHMVQEAIAQRYAAERNYGMQQYPAYSSPIDASHYGTWGNRQVSSPGSGSMPPQPGPPQSPMTYSGWPYQQQALAQQMQQLQLQQQEQEQMYSARYGGYYAPQSGYGTR